MTGAFIAPLISTVWNVSLICVKEKAQVSRGSEAPRGSAGGVIGRHDHVADLIGFAFEQTAVGAALRTWLADPGNIHQCNRLTRAQQAGTAEEYSYPSPW